MFTHIPAADEHPQEQELTESSADWMQDYALDLIRWEGEGGAWVRRDDADPETPESPSIFIMAS